MSRPPHLARLYNSNYTWRRVQIMSSPLCSFLHPPVTPSLFGPNILLNTLFSNTRSLSSYLNVMSKCTDFKIKHGGLCDGYLSIFRSYLYSLLPANKINSGRVIADMLHDLRSIYLAPEGRKSLSRSRDMTAHMKKWRPIPYGSNRSHAEV
jgi:hypothetical protein